MPGGRPDRSGSLGVWLAVLALVVFLPEAFTRWFLPKELLLLVALVFASRAPARGRMPRTLWVLIGVGALLLALAAFASDGPVGAIMGRWPRYEGLISLPVYVAAVWVGTRLLGPHASIVRLGSFTRALVAASLLIGVVSFLEGLGLRPIAGDADRPGSLLGNATDQGLIGAAIVLLLLPPFATACAAARAKLVASGSARIRGAARIDVVTWPATLALGVIASVLTVVISASRAGLLALGAGLLVVMLVQVRERVRLSGPRAGWLAAGQGAALALLLAGITFAVPAMRVRLLGMSELSLSTITDRFAIWQTTSAMIAERPLLGVGPSGFLDAIAVRHDADWYSSVGAGTVLDSPHNWLLQAAAAGGIPLLVAAVVLAGMVLVTAIRRMRSAESSPISKSGPTTSARFDLLHGGLGAIVGLGIGLLTHFTTAPTGILLGLLIGVLTAVGPRPDRRHWRRIRTGLFVLWLVAFAVVTVAEIPLASGVQARTATDADTQFTIAQALRPWDADITSIAAQSLTARADSGDKAVVPVAVEWAERAVKAQPANLATQYTLGVAWRAAGKLDAASELFARLQKTHPADPRVIMQLGVTRIVEGDHAAGLALIVQANRLNPDDDSIARTLAWARSLTG